MDHRRLFHYVLIGILLGLLYVAFLMVRPYLTYLILGMILTYLFHPVYRHLRQRTGRPRMASIIMIIFILLIIIIPSAFIITGLIDQSRNAYNQFRTMEIDYEALSELPVVKSLEIDAEESITQVAKHVRDYFVTSVPDILGSVAELLLGLFIMFFFLYYGFLDGERWLETAKRGLPLDQKHKDELFRDMGTITNAVVYGQFLTAVIQGTLGGLMFVAFGIPNPIFWGVIMIILSFIPFLGTPLVWAPIGLLQLARGEYLSGIGILIIGTVVVMNVDNVLKPYLISSRSKLNTLLILLGVFGGLQLFGFIGIVLGPLILALLQTVIGFFNEHTRPAIAAKAARTTAKAAGKAKE